MKKNILHLLIHTSIFGFSVCGEIKASDIDPKHLENKPAVDDHRNLNNIPKSLQAKIMNNVAEAEEANNGFSKKPLKHLAKQSLTSHQFNKAMEEALNSHKLDILSRDLTDENVQKIKHIGNLSLHIIGNPLNDDQMKRIGELTNLKGLTFDDPGQVKGDQLRFLSGLNNIESLTISKQSVSNEDLKHLSHLKSLTTLRFNFIDISSEGLKYLIKSTHLLHLDIANTNISDDDVKFISEKFPHIETINLNNTKITNAALESLLKLTSLKGIELKHTSITDDGLKILYKISTLELDIRGIKETKATPEGIEELKKHFENVY
ncbi:MAG: hypothetical protein ACOH2E_03840 [Candidatus Paracaedibacter sp.]